jgi:excisionase family DNA binding protein
MTKKLLTIPEAAEALRLKPSTLRAWLLRRRISSYRVGRLVRISSEEIEKLLRDSQVPAKGQSVLEHVDEPGEGGSE